MQLFILNDDNAGVPVTWGEYEQWHDRLPKDERCSLGRRLRQDTIGNATVATTFLGTPIGFHGRKPQLWISVTLGPGLYKEAVYSSHRAALNGHSNACRQLKKGEDP